MKNRKSPIWKPSKKEFQLICDSYKSLADIIRHFNLPPTGNYETIKTRIKEDKIDISHIKLGLNSNGGRRFFIKYKSKEEVVKSINAGKIRDPGAVREQIKKWNILPYDKCAICNFKGKWNDKLLVFQMDHIDGNSTHHHISNLRFICPNCHSQTDTFGNKNGSLIRD